MSGIARFVGQELMWVQPNLLKWEFELQSNGERVGTLVFRSALGSFATAENEDGCWTFKRVGFWNPRITVRLCGAETDLAVFTSNTWTHGGTLDLQDGRKLLASTDFWQTRYDVRTEGGETLLHFTRHPGAHLSATVEVALQAASVPELSWMIMLGWYLVVLLYRDS